MSEPAEYKRWETPSGNPPITIRYGDHAWQTQVKIGDQWLPVEYLRVEYRVDNNRYTRVTISLAGHITYERVGAGEGGDQVGE